MAKAVGKDCTIVTLPTGHVFCPDKVRLTDGQRLINTTCFGDSYEGNTGGLKFGRVSVEGTPKYNVSTSNPGFGSISSTGGAFSITVASGCTVSGTMIVSDNNLDIDVNDASRITLNGVTDGAVTSVWDETP